MGEGLPLRLGTDPRLVWGKLVADGIILKHDPCQADRGVRKEPRQSK